MKHIYTPAQLDDVAENVRRARAIAYLTQVAADAPSDCSDQTSLAMCVIDDLLSAAEAGISSMGTAKA